MSKEKPEVGDVWRYKYGDYAYILRSDWSGVYWINGNDYFANGNFNYEIRHWRLKSFLRDFTYLGKSKANINDLFEVKK